MIRVGVIGYGTMGKLHSSIYKNLAGVELKVVADADPNRRAAAEHNLGVQIVAAATDVIADDSIDVVDICLPTNMHAQIVTEAVAANKHIYVEKPLTRTLDQGKQLVDLVANYDKKVSVGHVVRFSTEYEKARQAVLNGSIGKPAVVRTFRGGSKFPQGWQDWYGNYEYSGGVILDLAIHDIDFLRWCFGDVKRVYAKSTRGRTSERLEHTMIVLRFENGVIAHVEASWTNFPGQFYTTFEFAGDQGLISYDSRQTAPITYVGTTSEDKNVQVSVPESPVLVSPYQVELASFIESIKTNQEPQVTVSDAYKSLEVALGALKSAENDEVITL